MITRPTDLINRLHSSRIVSSIQFNSLGSTDFLPDLSCPPPRPPGLYSSPGNTMLSLHKSVLQP